MLKLNDITQLLNNTNYYYYYYYYYVYLGPQSIRMFNVFVFTLG